MKRIKISLIILSSILYISATSCVFAHGDATASVPAINSPDSVVKTETSKQKKKKKSKSKISEQSKLESPVPVTAGESDKKTEAAEIPAVNNEDISFDINNTQKPEIKISEPKKVEGQLFDSEQDKVQNAFQMQKKMDVEDIKMLWESTVERNTVIKFALRKLAMPAEQRRIHSSMMARSVSALISGVAILPNLLGFDTLTSSASMVGGSLANRVIQNKTMPKVMPLTDSELIQLAKLVTELQDRIITNYYEYKSSIDALKVCRQNLLLQNKNYSEALNTGNSIAIIAASSLYDKELMNELRLKQQIKLKRLELERLAGPEVVTGLNLTKLESFSTDTVKKEMETNSKKPDVPAPEVKVSEIKENVKPVEVKPSVEVKKTEKTQPVKATNKKSEGGKK